MGLKNKNIEDFYPLSPMQQGILFHSLAAQESGVYFEQFSFTLRGTLNVAAFSQAWQHIVERYSILRTGFVWEGLKEPAQVVHRQVTFPWVQHDWRTLSSDEQTTQLENFLQADRIQGFELSRPPLMRLALFQFSEACYNFTWSHHHLLLDGWSVAVIFKEILTCYQAFSNGEDIYLEPTRPYRDYIVWLQQQNLSEAETFWRRMLKGFTAPTKLLMSQGSNAGNPSVEPYYDERELKLSGAMTAALRSFAKQNQLTLNTLVQGAWALLLSRYSREQDVVFGVTVSGRPSTLAKAESMVGLFINTLPLRVQVEPEASLLLWLQRIQAHQAEARQYEYSPLVNVQGWSDVPRGLPLFESIVVFENYPVEASLQEQSADLEVHRLRSFEKTNYPLTLNIGPGSELAFKLVYEDDDRFDAAAISRMLGHLKTLLESMVTSPDQRLSELPMLTEAERYQLLMEWNNTQAAYPKEQCIHHLFEVQVARSPNAIAVVFGEKQLSYEELNVRANQLAHYLQQLGIGPEKFVGVCLERSPELVIALLGILKAGGAYVFLEPTYPEERLSFILSDTQLTALLTQQWLVERLPTHSTKTVYLNTAWEHIHQASQENPISDTVANNLAYILYTSGSTGKPKGVMVEHRSVLAMIHGFEQIAPSSKKLSGTSICPFSFDVSVWELFSNLCFGGKLHILSSEIFANSEHFVSYLVTHQVTSAYIPPALLSDVISQLERQRDKIKLARILVGVEPIKQGLLQRWRSQFNAMHIVNGYGPTESTICSTLLSFRSATDLERNVSIGVPVPGYQVYLCDSNLQPVPMGVVGEIVIGGVGLARGYLNRPILTTDKFIPNPFSNEPGARLYHTGDLARYLPDGNIEFIGRADFQVKIRGFRIELGEVQTVLCQHPAVQEAIVLAREDQPGDKRLVAYVVSHLQEALTTTDLYRFLKARLPGYMVPSDFVSLESLPRTPNGKVEQRLLPTPVAVRPELEVPYVMPRTEAEKAIATVWQQALKVEEIGINDNFFELGGHSLLVIRVHGQLRELLKADLSVVDIFRYPTISLLAEYVSRVQNQASSNNKTEIQTEKLEAGKTQQRKRLQKMKAIGKM